MAATRDAEWLGKALSQLRVHHDIVLVDQRGTGRSAPLDCEFYNRAELQPYFDPMWPIEKVRECRERLSSRADLTQYLDDLADVLTALGYANTRQAAPDV